MLGASELISEELALVKEVLNNFGQVLFKKSNAITYFTKEII